MQTAKFSHFRLLMLATALFISSCGVTVRDSSSLRYDGSVELGASVHLQDWTRHPSIASTVTFAGSRTSVTMSQGPQAPSSVLDSSYKGSWYGGVDIETFLACGVQVNHVANGLFLSTFPVSDRTQRQFGPLATYQRITMSDGTSERPPLPVFAYLTPGLTQIVSEPLGIHIGPVTVQNRYPAPMTITSIEFICGSALCQAWRDAPVQYVQLPSLPLTLSSCGGYVNIPVECTAKAQADGTGGRFKLQTDLGDMIAPFACNGGLSG